MVKKMQKTTSDRPTPPAGLLDSQLAQSVKESAQQIWLAGMGAFAKAQEGRLKVFEALIKEGASLQRKTQSAAEEKIGEVTDRMSAMAGDVTAKAGQHWDKLESIFEQRTAKAAQVGVVFWSCWGCAHEVLPRTNECGAGGYRKAVLLIPLS